ncbi:MAG TPA: hypothetical protein VFM86_10485 [Pedococcus sp.]|nr:hypothetical protein [Pedococcus sp.]
MATYDVHVGDGRVVRDFRAHITAASPSEAVQAARRAIPEPAWHGLVTVFRHRRLRGRALVGTYAAGGRGDDGSAGVREPRRPLPTPPGLSCEAEPPVPQRP